MYNIIEQHQNQSGSRNESTLLIMMALNDTKSKPVFTTTSNGFKIECAKECPCGVPVIPVPDQWLEVMVTGGFKVWHIIFIIIAFVIAIVVVYCCFHRCRIPRTKQEIEADLMRTNLAQKFSEYLQEFPNEPTSFLEALKKVQELEEKWANEQDDSGAKKRMGWLKLRGKERQTDKAQGADGAGDLNAAGKDENGSDANLAKDQRQASIEDGNKPTASNKEQSLALNTTSDKKPEVKDSETTTAKNAISKQSSGEDKIKSSILSSHKETGTKKPANDLRSVRMAQVSEGANTATDKDRATSNLGPTLAQKDVLVVKVHKRKGEKALERQTTKVKADIGSVEAVHTAVSIGEHDVNAASPTSGPTSSTGHHHRSKTRRKRDKPNLSRTKAAHVGSIDANTNVLTLPVATVHRRHHHSNEHHSQQQQPKQAATSSSTLTVETTPSKRETQPGKLQSRTKKQVVARGDSTFIRIQADLSPK